VRELVADLTKPGVTWKDRHGKVQPVTLEEVLIEVARSPRGLRQAGEALDQGEPPTLPLQPLERLCCNVVQHRQAKTSA
jgi:hypothetical protein